MKDNIIIELRKYLKENLSNERYMHSIRVYEKALELSLLYDVDSEKVAIASLAHDMTKENNEGEKQIIEKYFSNNEDLLKSPKAWHGYTGSIMLKEKFNIDDEQILNAVKYHTLGHVNMDNVAKVVFIADFLDPQRENLNLPFYNSLINDKKLPLDEVLFEVIKDNVAYLKSKDIFIPKQTLDLLDELENKFGN